jgi:NAD(P)-dependent dehydrogenase (short-subunit alcohol dehydrogenase family)
MLGKVSDSTLFARVSLFHSYTQRTLMISGPIRTPLLMDFLNTPEKLDRRMTHVPMGRFGEAVEQAKAVVFRMSPFPPFCKEGEADN